MNKVQNPKSKTHKSVRILMTIILMCSMLTNSMLIFQISASTANDQAINDNSKTVNSGYQNIPQFTRTIFHWWQWWQSILRTNNNQPEPSRTVIPTTTATPTPTTTPQPTQTPGQNQTTNQTVKQTGLNYLSTYHEYSTKYTSDAVLNRDFSMFHNDGVKVISLSLYWYRIEGHTRGDYNGTYWDGSYYGDKFLDDIKRVATIADRYNIEVMITFHTTWGDNSGWSVPNYVIDPTTGKEDCFAIVHSEDMKKAFINAVNHTASYLSSVPNICAWAILNEPWYNHNEGLAVKDSFVNLIQELSYTVKTLDNRPITVRFVNVHNFINSMGNQAIKNIFVDDWNWDNRLINAIDFICFNDYYPANSALENTWSSITTENVIGASKLKTVWITECGFPPSGMDNVAGANNDNVQTQNYETFLTLYNSLPINTVIAWYWRSDSSISNPGVIGQGRNLCADTEGTPRLAYFKLTSS